MTKKEDYKESCPKCTNTNILFLLDGGSRICCDCYHAWRLDGGEPPSEEYMKQLKEDYENAKKKLALKRKNRTSKQQ